MLPIVSQAGVALADTPYAVGKESQNGRWTTATNVEFIAGSAQKIAGWSQATASLTTGIPRVEHIWRDNSGNVRVGIGTETHLYYMSVEGASLTDITPLRTISVGTLSSPITTTANSQLVAIADSSQHLVNGDWVFLSAASAVGGVTLNGWYQVSSRSGSGYNITVPVAASSSAGPGGGTVNFQYPRVTLTNPFTTTSGSPTVKVTHTASGATQGEYVIFSGASAVGGLTISGEYQIQNILDANNYTITASSPASSNAGPGGGSVSVIYDIVVQQVTSNTGVGYGLGAYGVGAYGLGLTATQVLANGWTLDNYGAQLLAAPIGGTIYVFDPVLGGRAYPLLNAPSTLNAMFVTPERFVVALGINGNLMQMAWCDQNDYTVWTTTATNTANSGRTLIGGSYFTGGIGIRDGVSLIFTDKCAFQMNYTGGQEIYATPQIGDNCGLISPTAVCGEGGIVYWMSDQDWWMWNGGVQPLPSDDVRSYVFQVGSGILNRQQITKSTAALNRAKRQVRFWFPSQNATENSTGLIYQYDQQGVWSVLDFGKSCGCDATLISTPVSADTAGRIYYDETGTDANGVALAWELQLSDLDISNGDRNADVFGFIPDFQNQVGDIDLEIQTSYYPQQTSNTDGPYALSAGDGRLDLRSDGKLFSFSLVQDVLSGTFRQGVHRLDVQPSGSRH